MINYRRLTKTDLPQVIAFYKDACDHQQFDQYSPDWTWGVYPSEQSLKESLNDLFIGAFDDDGTLLGAGILTKGEDPDYPSEAWKISATDDQIAILHLLAVGPAARGKGVASGLLAQLKQVAKEAGAIVRRMPYTKRTATNSPNGSSSTTKTLVVKKPTYTN